VAVVDSKPVLNSELDFQVQIYEMQSGSKISDPKEVVELKREILKQMINDRLILLKAKADTTIKVGSDEVDDAFNQRVADLKGRFSSEEEFTQQLQSEGLTFRELKVKLREEVNDQLYKERLIAKLLSKVSVTKNEVERFYESYRDSFPEHPRSAKLAQILLTLKPSPESEDSIKALAQSLIERIHNGESFEELAKSYSQDLSAESGGDIGFFNRGDLLPEFERAAMALEPGGTSGVIKTKLGYHVIRLVEKAAERFHAKHILLLAKANPADSASLEKTAQEILARLARGEEFGLLVKEFSDDEASKANSGELGWFSVQELPPQYQMPLDTLTVNQISPPIWLEEGLHLIKILDRKEARPFSLTDDWDILKEYTRRQKTGEVIAAIVDEMKDKVYLEIRDF
jgi:peptidyl-prolyl cis-trans isomerase SurA